MRPLHAVAVAAAFLFVAAATPLSLSAAPASVLGGGGTVELARSPTSPAGFEAAGLPAAFAFARLPALDPARDAFVVVAPQTPFSGEEAQHLHRFLYEGGYALIAVDDAIGVRLLDDLGAGVTVSEAHVFTPAFNETPERVVVSSTQRFPELPREALATRPVLVTGGDRVLVTPGLTWLDTNDNGRPDLGETIQSGAVAAVANVGSGRLVVVGDPDLVRATSTDVARGFLAAAAADGRVLVFDEAHRARSDPFVANALLAGQPGLAVGTGILMTAVALGAVAVLAPRLEDRRAARRARVPDSVDPALLKELLSELDAR